MGRNPPADWFDLVMIPDAANVCLLLLICFLSFAPLLFRAPFTLFKTFFHLRALNRRARQAHAHAY